MNSLTCVERIIVESIGRGTKTITQLNQDTSLGTRLLLNILNALTLRGIISQREGVYAISKHISKEASETLQDFKNQKTEALELIESMLSQPELVKLKKVYISEKDKPILKALLANLNNFFQTLPDAKEEISLSQYSLFIWGEDLYGKNINRMVEGLI